MHTQIKAHLSQLYESSVTSITWPATTVDGVGKSLDVFMTAWSMRSQFQRTVKKQR